MDVGRRFFRAIETDDGWNCKQGSSVLDGHDMLVEAVHHLSALAEANIPSKIFAHYLDGTVISVATFD